MSNKKTDDYIDEYAKATDVHPVLTNKALYYPIICGGFAIICMALYFIALSIGDRQVQLFFFVTPVMAIRGLIVSLMTIKDRFEYIVWWRIGFYGCVAPMVAFVIVIIVEVLKIYFTTGF